MPKRHMKRRLTRKIKRTRRVMPRRRKTYRGGYDPSKDNGTYPTRMSGYPVGQSGALPDPSAHGESTKWY